MELEQHARNMDRILHLAVWLLATAVVGVAAIVQLQLGYSLPIIAGTALILLSAVAAWWAVEEACFDRGTSAPTVSSQ